MLEVKVLRHKSFRPSQSLIEPGSNTGMVSGTAISTPASSRAARALGLSVLLHALLIAGIGFVAAKPIFVPTAPPMVEVLLLPKSGSIQKQSSSQSVNADPKTASHTLNHEPLVKRYQDEIESLQASIDRLDREVFISAAQTPNDYSEWMSRWRQKVETTANRYAQSQDLSHLFGEVLLAVSVKADGQLHSVRVLNSSGTLTLDEAALHIAEIAGPFAPLPAIVRDEVDVLHITRTWRFTAIGTSVAF